MIKDNEAAGGYDLFSLCEDEEAQAEIIRLLYVAATRAADYLILSSAVDKLGEIKGPWLELLARRFDLLSGKALQADLQVKVTTTEPPLEKKPARTCGRAPLVKLWKIAQKEAKNGEGRLPKYLAPIAPDPVRADNFPFLV